MLRKILITLYSSGKLRFFFRILPFSCHWLTIFSHLKATQIPNGKLSEVTGFVIDPKDVIQVKQGENLTVSTSQELKIHKIKVKNTQGELVELLPLSNNLWSLQGLPPGVYLLDVIVRMSSGMLGAYGTILVILERGKQPLFPQQYITQMNTVIKQTLK